MRTFLIAGVAVLLPVASLSRADDLKMFDAQSRACGRPHFHDPDGRYLRRLPCRRSRLRKLAANASEAQRRGSRGHDEEWRWRPAHQHDSQLPDQGLVQPRHVFEPTARVHSTGRESSSSSKIQIHVECDASYERFGKSVGDMTIERIDGEHAKGNMVTKVSARGHDMTMNMTFDSKFISADCGDVKPFTAKVGLSTSNRFQGFCKNSSEISSGKSLLSP